MPIKTSISSKGGAKLKAVLAKAEQNRGKRVKVGFFSTAKYEDGTLVANVGERCGHPGVRGAGGRYPGAALLPAVRCHYE